MFSGSRVKHHPRANYFLQRTVELPATITIKSLAGLVAGRWWDWIDTCQWSKSHFPADPPVVRVDSDGLSSNHGLQPW